MHTSSNWTMAAVYGGLAVAMINPVASAVVAAACYKVKKKLEEREIIERKVRNGAAQAEFRRRFYRRQNFSSYEEYLASDTWRKIREQILERAGGICEKPNCTHPLEDVHHTWYPWVWGREPLTALIGLCRKHHEDEHGRGF